jgi:hypothetical protein
MNDYKYAVHKKYSITSVFLELPIKYDFFTVLI